MRRAEAEKLAGPQRSLLGEALLGQRKTAEAERAFAAAARLKLQWGAVRMRWAETLWRLGKRDDARGRLAAAAGMMLKSADRNLLETMTRKASR